MPRNVQEMTDLRKCARHTSEHEVGHIGSMIREISIHTAANTTIHGFLRTMIPANRRNGRNEDIDMSKVHQPNNSGYSKHPTNNGGHQAAARWFS